MAPHSSLWLPLDLYGYYGSRWLPSFGSLWLSIASVAIYGSLLLTGLLNSFLWILIAPYGTVWLPMAPCGYAWLSMDAIDPR